MASSKKSTAGKRAGRKTAKKGAARSGSAVKRPRTGRTAAVREEEIDDGAPAGSTSLVIVESPAKARTIGKYLGRGYRVRATVGHIRDLPAKKLGIDVENGFQP